MVDININYPLYDTVYHNFPTQQLYITLYKRLSSEYKMNLGFDETGINFIKSKGFVEISRTSTCKIARVSAKYEERFYINDDEKMFLIAVESHDDEKTFDFTILYDITNGEFTKHSLYKGLIKLYKPKKKYNINLIKSENGYMDTEGFTIEIPEVDIELNYGKDFLKVHEAIVKRLNKDNDKGIILLHGVSGSGKSTYIKYLTKLINDKEIIFVPPAMTEALTDPSIIPFLMERKNSILIVEDGEKIISDRNNNDSSAGVSNILNLTDGILGDCLNIQFIITFNMERSKIDKAMTRKGRLIAEHEFNYLSIEETNALLKHIGKDYISNKKMTLADIYNVDEEEYMSTKKTNKIGFQ